MRPTDTTVGRLVDMVTRYGLDAPGIESQSGRNFLHPSKQALRPTEPTAQLVPDLFPGSNWPVRGFDHPPSSSAEVKERVALYLYSPSGPSGPVLG